ncbi:hypothetical protein C2845_PM06G18560 [Panicum miliaceum]|uniref:Epidermal patterning factor-like protein n=1 Tax=Panicum miliaceum TaxID=4540 RepID=A0A3L6RCM3_PANMI|nr:hypothetical protein C2845_PM06G18560 [Panicum miliaceum]
MGRGRPGRWRGRSARSLGVVACAFAVAAALVVSLCFVGGALASDLRRKTEEAAAAGAHPGDDQVVATSEVRASMLLVPFRSRRTRHRTAASGPPYVEGARRKTDHRVHTPGCTVLLRAPAGRRLLSGGPGSHPPRCTSKCGSCSPCYPVHVSVPPGVLVTTEYYPEAWRCKCRNQLYMP